MKPDPESSLSDEMMESQWMDRALPCFTDVPERRLLVAVLMDAVRCLQTSGRPRTEVVSWLRGERATARIPFEFLCDSLGLEAAPLARRLLLPVVPGGQLYRRVRVQARSDRRLRVLEAKSGNPLPAMEPTRDAVSTPIALPWTDVA